MGWQNITFNQLIVQGNAAGIFIYNGTPALGTLIGSWTATAGSDLYGNIYPQGLYVVTKANINNASLINATLSNAQLTASLIAQSTVFESTVTFDTAGGQLLMYTTTTATYTIAANTATWTAPAGSYTTGDVRVWGSGAAGAGGFQNAYSGSAGGAGAFAETSNYPLTPGTVYVTAVYNGGAGVLTANPIPGSDAGNYGNASTFDYTNLTGPGVRASGGTCSGGSPGGGLGGQPVTGTIGFNGGNGAVTGGRTGHSGGGGGGAGGPRGQGNNGAQSNGSAGNNGGTSPGGGAGGAGGPLNGNGSNGVTPGGGGGGAGFTATGYLMSGSGGDGRITVTISTGTTVLIGTASPVAGTDINGNAYPAGFGGQITAFQPNTAPTVAETWHYVGTSGQPAFGTGWANFGGGFANLAFKYKEDNQVEIRGKVAPGSVGTQVFTLPAGYRPASTQTIGYFVTNVSATTTASWPQPAINISTTGVVSQNGNSTPNATGVWISGTIDLSI